MNTEIKTLNGWYEFSNRTGKESLVSDSNKSFDEISDGKYSSNRIKGWTENKQVFETKNIWGKFVFIVAK